ncbi:predicted Fe-S protein [Vibrio ponticus]|nr:predicted Fe-S protein [Vibrio ponticus]
MRKREERFNWLSMSSAQQLHVLKLCRQRYRRKVSAKTAMQENGEGTPPSSPQQSLFD